MKFLRLGDRGSEQPAVLAVGPDGREHAYSLSPLTSDIDGAFLADDGVTRVRAALAARELSEIDGAEGLRVGAPVARPGSVIGIGLNYAAHAAESGLDLPTAPIVFLKPSNTVVGPHDPAPIPPSSAAFDWEAELAIVVGRAASYLATDGEAAACIAGYTLADDLSERDYQTSGSGQWTKGKSLPGSTPLGPWLVPADELDASALRVRSWVNGEARQDAHTDDLVFGPTELVRYCSQYMLLEPGDVILTGTPAGVALSGRFPYLAPGDTLEAEIEGLGRQRQKLYRAGAISTAPELSF
ncbi:fumarylacetoacetate hydrolase family protein [Sinomonas sp. ASV322]|uniref:fumarylacetoacetate hydrolase family protein n=1 Tax=Sinomonas sp. ASV322 TaxID=3041920 RepID=UPI0027DE9E91|nr:fumarylacetoacetate hydrolase family protein [Sinomonas sp. ASV322]MDQ4502488.1 fumarylacetoacetate hydrolase family protein [Sinomonas sp. ASV322]